MDGDSKHSSGYYVQAGPVTVTINGTKVLNTTSRFSMHGGGGYKKSGTITVSHGADGSKSVSMSVKAAIYSASVNCTGSKTYSLNKINRYALLGDAPNFNDEGNPTITFTNPAGSALVQGLQVRFKWNEGASSTGYINIPSNLWDGGSYTLILDNYRTMLRNATPNSNTLAVTYDLKSTLNGTDYHSEKAATMNIVNASPTAGAVSYSDINADVVGITGSDQTIVQAHSTLRIHTNAATAKKGASISSYVLKFNGTNYTPNGSGNVDFVKPNISGNYNAIVTVTDSRGNTASVTKTIPITGWAQPSALYSWSRVENFVTNDSVLRVDGKIATVPGSTMKITESHREKNTGSWSTPVEINDNVDVTIGGLDYQREYEMKVTVSDTFTRNNIPAGQHDTVYTLGLGKGIPIAFFDALRHSVGVNGLPDADEQLFVGGQVKCDSMYVKDISTLYSITKTGGAWDATNINAYRMGNAVYLRIRLKGSGATVNVGSNGFTGTLSGGPLPLYEIGGANIAGSSGIINKVQSDGSVISRVIGAAMTMDSNNATILAVTFLTAN